MLLLLEFMIALNYRLFVPIICWKVACGPPLLVDSHSMLTPAIGQSRTMSEGDWTVFLIRGVRRQIVRMIRGS